MLAKKYHLLWGNAPLLQQGIDAMSRQRVDEIRRAPDQWQPSPFATTLAAPCEVSGPATYSKGKIRTLRFLPSTRPGWHFKRTDLPGELPIAATLANVARSDRAIILRAGPDENRFRMSEHVIAHRLGLGLDDVLIECDSEDPPLFDVGSMPIVNALQDAGIVPSPARRRVGSFTVKQPVAVVNPNGSFLIWEPATPGNPILSLDIAIDFPTAIGCQRIRTDLNPEIFAYGAQARTNCSAKAMFMARTIGWFSSEIRNLGYTKENILIAGKKRYCTTPRMVLANGKSVEAVWHRTCLDLIAALSLLPDGHPAGHIISYKAGHSMDVHFLSRLLGEELLTTPV